MPTSTACEATDPLGLQPCEIWWEGDDYPSNVNAFDAENKPVQFESTTAVGNMSGRLGWGAGSMET
ncbi:MAG TPA: hypothetical protein VN709_06910 [Terriglobales bacterium]|nr:hypothetical protein [Terriglobales bacterium]